MSDDERYLSDYSDYDYDDDVDYTGAEGAEDENDDDILIAPADPNEGVDVASDSETEYDEESEPEAVDEDDDNEEQPDIEELELEKQEEEEEELDIKQVSSHIKEIVVVKPENRRSSHILSKFEMTEIVNIRATQISQYNNCMVDITGLDDPILMSKRELMMRMCPLTLRKHVGDVRDSKTGEIRSYYEIFDTNEMMFSVTYPEAM